MRSRFIYIFILFFATNNSTLFANLIGLNGINLEKSEDAALNFMVGGHLYGSGANKSGYPASTLMANIDSINGSDIDFLVSLGDLFSNLETDLETYKYGLLNKLKIPLFNAVGNHDVFDPKLYQKEFGKTFFSFIRANSLFIILDTEEGKGNISGNQLELIKNCFYRADKEEIKNIFLFSHRPIWLEQFPEIDEIFDGADKARFSTFESTIAPLLQRTKAKIFWFSGSMGGNAKESFFLKKEGNIKYFLTAIRDRKEDGLLKVEIDESGIVTFKTISLTGRETKVIGYYNVDYWKNLEDSVEMSWPVFKFYAYRTITHRYFWIGGLTCVVVVVVLQKLFATIK